MWIACWGKDGLTLFWPCSRGPCSWHVGFKAVLIQTQTLRPLQLLGLEMSISPSSLALCLTCCAGKIKRVEIKKSYAFVQYENLEDAEYAMKRTHLSNLDGRTVTVC